MAGGEPNICWLFFCVKNTSWSSVINLINEYNYIVLNRYSSIKDYSWTYNNTIIEDDTIENHAWFCYNNSHIDNFVWIRQLKNESYSMVGELSSSFWSLIHIDPHGWACFTSIDSFLPRLGHTDVSTPISFIHKRWGIINLYTYPDVSSGWAKSHQCLHEFVWSRWIPVSAKFCVGRVNATSMISSLVPLWRSPEC
jgi:hypothetical protein